VFDDRSPIYRQIADQIKEDVVRGVLADDAQVMSTNQYAASFRINPATAAKAFQELIEEGVLYKQRGLGMFVQPGTRDRLLAERRKRFFEDVVDPVAEQAAVLGIDVDDVVRRLREKGSKR
jgi:DNA-binding transcriptional regulator YhcF (GntR family)